MIKAIIVEDEPRDMEVLLKALRNYCTDVQVVATANSIAEAEKAIKDFVADLVFLDIELPDGRAFDLLKKIQDLPIKIIFTTAHPEYAARAFRFSAVDYLLKPLNFLELKNAIEKVKEGTMLEIEKSKIRFMLENMGSDHTAFNKIAIPDRKGVKFIPVDDIIYIEADGNYSKFILSDKREVLSSHNLKEYEEILSEYCFTRISKSHIVNLNHVDEYRAAGEVITDSKHEIPVGRQYRDNLLARINACNK